MLKKYSSQSVILLICISSCSPYPIMMQTYNDPFTNSTRKRLEITLIPRELLVSNKVQLTFVKEEVANDPSNLTLYAQLFINNRQFRLKPEFYALIDTQAYKKTVTNLETDGLLNQPITLANLDSSNTKMLSYYNYSHCPSYRFSIPLTTDEVENLQTAQILAYRFYLGPREVTARLSYLQLSRLKQLLEY